MDNQSAYDELKDNFLIATVWSGFHTPEEVLADALEGLADGVFSDEPIEVVDEDLVRRLVEEEFARKRKAEQTWPQQTTCDRLTQAFESLTARGILSLENAGYSMSDGWAEWDKAINTEWAPVGALSALRGGCFYHGQDLERAVLGGGLCVAFTAKSGVDNDGIPIAQEVIEALRAHGFQPEWNGKPNARICFPIDWQRRYGPPASPAPAIPARQTQ